eukprot:1136693-Prymnesium_polylepis.2
MHGLEALLRHEPSDGGFMFASFLATAIVFSIYAFNLFLVSLGNVQNSSVTALTVSTAASLCALAYQVPVGWGPYVADWVDNTFQPVAESLVLDAKSPGFEGPAPLQLLTYICWMLIFLLYAFHLSVELGLGRDFWKWGKEKLCARMPARLHAMLPDRRSANSLPAMLIGAGLIELMVNLSLVALAWQVLTRRVRAHMHVHVHVHVHMHARIAHRTSPRSRVASCGCAARARSRCATTCCPSRRRTSDS